MTRRPRAVVVLLAVFARVAPEEDPHASRARPPSAAVGEDEAVCFNDCSGHGECRGWTCACELGWAGDDCGHALYAPAAAAGGAPPPPPVLGAGHFNVSARALPRALAESGAGVVLVGFASRSCHKCLGFEREYAAAAPALAALGVPLARADADAADARPLARELEPSTLPALVAYVARAPARRAARAKKKKKKAQQQELAPPPGAEGAEGVDAGAATARREAHVY